MAIKLSQHLMTFTSTLDEMALSLRGDDFYVLLRHNSSQSLLSSASCPAPPLDGLPQGRRQQVEPRAEPPTREKFQAGPTSRAEKPQKPFRLQHRVLPIHLAATCCGRFGARSTACSSYTPLHDLCSALRSRSKRRNIAFRAATYARRLLGALRAARAKRQRRASRRRHETSGTTPRRQIAVREVHDDREPGRSAERRDDSVVTTR